LCLWGGRTPATATDLISDIVVNLRGMLVASGSVKRYLGCSLLVRNSEMKLRQKESLRLERLK
jgi:hypothetical protein